MYAEPQSGVARRSRWWLLVALMVAAAGLGAREARADIQVHVMNCTPDSDDLEFQSYDAKDSVKVVAADTKKVNSKGASATLKCAGEGKGYCQMVLAILDKPIPCANTDSSGGIAGSLQFNLDSGKWVVVTGFTVETKGSSKLCKPVVQLNLDSGSCS